MSEELMAAPPSGGGAHTTRPAGLIHSYGSAGTRAMREQARRRRESEAKLQLHLQQQTSRDKPADRP